jgi:glycosyltransferase involved in cell wall biosynthesis
MKVLALWQGMGGVEYHRLYTPLKRLQIDHAEEIEVNVSQDFQKAGLPELKQYDLVLFNRDLGENHYEILHYLAKHEIPYIVDIDDHWVLPKFHPVYKYYREHKLKQRIIDAIRYADGVTTTTDFLANEIRQYNQNVQVLPNALDLTDEQWLLEPQQRDVITFGWVGGITHSNDIMLISDAIAQMCDYYGDKVRFVLCGYQPGSMWESILYKFNGCAEKLRSQVVVAPSQNVNEYGNFYRLFDVALAPLENTKWNNCKSELKIIEAAAYGLPVIASEVAPYLSINPGVKFTVNTPEAWFAAMRQMYEQSDLKMVGENNQKHTNKIHDLTTINQKRLSFYQQLCK